MKLNFYSQVLEKLRIKQVYSAKLGILGNIPTKFQLNPFSSFGGFVSTRFAFNWCSRLGAVTQKLSR